MTEVFADAIRASDVSVVRQCLLSANDDLRQVYLNTNYFMMDTMNIGLSFKSGCNRWVMVNCLAWALFNQPTVDIDLISCLLTHGADVNGVLSIGLTHLNTCPYIYILALRRDGCATNIHIGALMSIMMEHGATTDVRVNASLYPDIFLNFVECVAIGDPNMSVHSCNSDAVVRSIEIP